MTNVVLGIIITALGLVLGSFAGASVWRLRARQLVDDKKDGEKVSAKEFKTLKPLAESTMRNDRSRCLHCGHTLAWYDLIPIVSWLSTGGKCRYCKKTIGWFEPLIEVGMAALLVLLYTMWPVVSPGGTIVEFILWIVVAVMLVILFAYDLKWFLLPNVIVFPLIAFSAVIAMIRILGMSDTTGGLLSLLGSIVLLGGLYGALYYFSYFRYGEEKTWVGFGDVKLGVALGLLLGDWKLAFLTVFLANLIGVIIVLPALVSKKLTMKAHVPFGPLLILGFFIALFFGTYILEWYGHLSGLSIV